MGTSYGFEASTLRQNNLKRAGEQALDPPALPRVYAGARASRTRRRLPLGWGDGVETPYLGISECLK
ncbi:MAG: hypothetical protein ACREXM_18995 [Gammaproteobacteria bacterium]